MNIRAHLIAATVLVSTLVPTRAPAEEFPIDAQEFKLWRDYQDALADARVQKMPEKQRLPAIAKNFRVPESKLAAAIEKGGLYGDKVAAKAEEAIRAALADTELAGRITQVKVDAAHAHIIAFVIWTPDRAELIDREACLVAARARKAASIVSTLKVAVVPAGAAEGASVFEGLISAEAADRIKEASIVDFASSRYLKLFEKVKRTEM